MSQNIPVAANSNLPLWEQATERAMKGTALTGLTPDEFAALLEKAVATCKPKEGHDPLATMQMFVDGFRAGRPPLAGLSEYVVTGA